MLKLVLIGCIGSLAAFNILFIGFHIITLDFVVDYQEMVGDSPVEQKTSLLVYTLISFPIIFVVGGIQSLFIWPFSALGLWVWSKFKPIELEYYDIESK